MQKLTIELPTLSFEHIASIKKYFADIEPDEPKEPGIDLIVQMAIECLFERVNKREVI